VSSERKVIDLMAALRESLNKHRCEAVHFRTSVRCKLDQGHDGEHVAGSGFGETRWSTQAGGGDAPTE